MEILYTKDEILAQQQIRIAPARNKANREKKNTKKLRPCQKYQTISKLCYRRPLHDLLKQKAFINQRNE